MQAVPQIAQNVSNSSNMPTVAIPPQVVTQTNSQSFSTNEVNQQGKESIIDIAKKTFKGKTFVTSVILISFFVFASILPIFAFSIFSIINFIAHLLFMVLVWLPIGKKLESSSGSTRYGYFFLINIVLIICLFPFIWIFGFTSNIFIISHLLSYFAMYETILVALSNRESKTRFFFWKVHNGKSPFVITTFFLMFDILNPFGILVLIFTYISYEKISKGCNLTNDGIGRFENRLNCLIAKIPIYYTLSAIQIQQSQPAQTVNNVNYSPVVVLSQSASDMSNITNINATES